MRLTRTFAGVALAVGVATAVAAPGTAVAAPTALTGTKTTVVTAPGVAGALLRNGILPVVTSPGTVGLTLNQGTLALRAGFPVTGGAVDLGNLSGTVEHQGGIRFYKWSGGQWYRLAVTNFTINLNDGKLYATAAYQGASLGVVPLFDLDLSGAKVSTSGGTVKVSGVQLRLTSAVAGALAGTPFGGVFKSGLWFGTATANLTV